ncbi:MAG: trypsin-like serine protease [Candidatus Gracilibacteria bacterium]|nr:trypsin-like serine protease [Candidatus Gracilibacteria bacterium]
MISIILIIFSLLSGFFGSYIFSTIHQSSFGNTITNGKQVTITQLENEITGIVETVSPGVVNIVISKDLTIYRNDPYGFFRQPVGNVKRKVGGGTGFFITKDGVILTNKHVVGDPGAEYTVILNDGTEYPAEVLALDPLTDLAVIRIHSTREFQPLSFITEYDGENSEIKIGQFAIATGNALAEFKNSVSFGVVSGLNRSIQTEGEKLTGLLQTDAAINPGNSGGPLINLDGKVMGINTAISGNAQGIGFSIPLSQSRIDFLLRSIEEFGEIKKPFIGIKYILLTAQSADELDLSIDSGAYIKDTPGSILKGSSAEKAGLEPGDIIIKVDGVRITPSNDLISFIQNKVPGQSIQLEVMKKNQDIKKIYITLGIQK